MAKNPYENAPNPNLIDGTHVYDVPQASVASTVNHSTESVIHRGYSETRSSQVPVTYTNPTNSLESKHFTSRSRPLKYPNGAMVIKWSSKPTNGKGDRIGKSRAIKCERNQICLRCRTLKKKVRSKCLEVNTGAHLLLSVTEKFHAENAKNWLGLVHSGTNLVLLHYSQTTRCLIVVGL
jgi:hypothetical protein